MQHILRKNAPRARLIREALAMIFIMLAVCAACSRTPRIHLDAREHHIGDVTTPGQYSHVFHFKNVGTGTLVIEKVKPG
ncbi:MAG TPA: hypothetical protein PLG31_01870 [Spirochaetota bacterium]|nr:hypothetical protein [Spirochaetota bacterium]